MSSAAPPKSDAVPSVTTKNDSLSRAIARPLSSAPIAVPATTMIAMAAGAGTPAPMSLAHPTPDSARTPPMDRSNPPTSNTNVKPIAATSSTALVLRMLMRLS